MITLESLIRTLKKYLPILISLMVFSITIMIFLHNEKFDEHLPFDATKFGTVITILGIILNSLTIYLLYKQIEEMAEARKASYQPKLFPKQISYITYDRSYSNIIDVDGQEKREFSKYPIFQKKKEPKSIYDIEPDLDEMDDLDYIPPGIEIINIGLGAAIEVYYRWRFDIQKVKKIIEDTYIVDDDECEDRLTFSFINPQSSIEITLPFIYMTMYGKSLNNQQNYYYKPCIYLDIEYEDINGYHYNYTFVSRIINNGNLVEVNFTKNINRF